MCRSLAWWLVMLFSVLAVVTVAFAEQEEGRGLGQDKVTLCHNGHLIRVGKPAQDAHLNHRDTLDLEACGDQPAAPSTPGTTDTTGTTTDTTGTTGTCTTGTTDTTTDTTTGTTDTRGTNTTGTADISGTTTTGDTTFARDLKNGFGEVPISTGPPLRTRCAALPTLTSCRADVVRTE